LFSPRAALAAGLAAWAWAAAVHAVASVDGPSARLLSVSVRASLVSLLRQLFWPLGGSLDPGSSVLPEPYRVRFSDPLGL
jgi:hypothetical protein